MPSLYIINPNKSCKNNAKQLLATDVAFCNADRLVSETWYKAHQSFHDIDSYTFVRFLTEV